MIWSMKIRQSYSLFWHLLLWLITKSQCFISFEGTDRQQLSIQLLTVKRLDFPREFRNAIEQNCPVVLPLQQNRSLDNRLVLNNICLSFCCSNFCNCFRRDFILDIHFKSSYETIVTAQVDLQRNQNFIGRRIQCNPKRMYEINAET